MTQYLHTRVMAALVRLLQCPPRLINNEGRADYVCSERLYTCTMRLVHVYNVYSAACTRISV